MQASVLFSLAVSTDFTVAAGKRGICFLRRSCEACHRRRPGTRNGEAQKIEQERQRALPSKKMMRKNRAEWII